MARRKLAAEMNVVPYIDVMLVLLVIFMITAPLLTQGIDIDLPDASATPMQFDPENEPVVLSVDGAGRLYMTIGESPDQPIDTAEVTRLMQILLDQRPDAAVVVEADATVAYQHVMRAMAALQAAGTKRIGFAADPELLTQ